MVSLYAPRTQTLSVLARAEWPEIGGGEHGHFDLPLAASAKECPAPEAAAEPTAGGPS